MPDIDQQESIEVPNIEDITYKAYARVDEFGRVVKLFSNCFETPMKHDILLKEGNTDDVIHIQGSYVLYDMSGCHNYKIDENGNIVCCTDEEKRTELAQRPKPKPTTQQQLRADIDFIATMCNIEL